MEHDPRCVVAVGAGVAEDLDGQGGELAVPVSGHADLDVEGMPGGGGGQRLGAGELELHRAAQPCHGQGDDVLDQDLLLAAEAAADAAGDNPHRIVRQAEDPFERALDQERDLRRGAHGEDPRVVEPAGRGVRLQRDVLHALGVEGFGVAGVAAGQGGVHVAHLVVDLDHDVARRVGNARCGGLAGVDRRRAVGDRLERGEDRRQGLVVDPQRPDPGLGDGHGVGHDRRDALALEAHHGIEDAASRRDRPR